MTPKKKKRTRNKTTTRTELITTSFNCLPIELITYILSLSLSSITSLPSLQSQRFSQSLVCKTWYHSQPHSDFETIGFLKTRRLAQLLSTPPPRPRATKSSHSPLIKRLAIDLIGSKRREVNSIVGKLLKGTPKLKALDLRLRGSESRIVSTMGVEVYNRLKELDLEEFCVRFEWDETPMTLGGNLTEVLQSWPNLRILSLPAVRVPLIDAIFPYNPSLTSLSLHLISSTSLPLLSHLLQTSSKTLHHLSLFITPSSTLDLSTLPNLLTPLSPKLHSLSILRSNYTHPSRQTTSPTDTDFSLLPLQSILLLLPRLTSLTLSFIPSFPLPLNPTLTTLRSLTFNYNWYHLISILEYLPYLGSDNFSKEVEEGDGTRIGVEIVRFCTGEKKAKKLGRKMDWKGKVLERLGRWGLEEEEGEGRMEGEKVGNGLRVVFEKGREWESDEEDEDDSSSESD